MTDLTDTPPLPVLPPAKRLGGAMSAAMVIGTMIGSGIYLLPTTLAPFGPNLVAAFALTIAGTMCLAIAFARLAGRIPGGPFVYVRSAFGDTAAFVTMWSYLISQWTGVAAVAVAVAGAIGFVVPAAGSGIGLTIVALGTIAILTMVNLAGARSAGWVQLAATLIKIIPLFAVVILVAARFGTGQPVEQLAPVPITVAGIAAAAALMLFSLTGFESATVVANVTDDASHTVPRATILGTGFTGLIYLTATVAALMLLPSAIAADSSAPFADAISPILGSGAGAVVAVIAAISAFGTCNALLLLSAEVGRSLASANDLPPLFRRANAAGAPTGSLLVGASIATLLVLASSSESFVEVYKFIALVSTVASLVLYTVCSTAALRLGVMGPWLIVAGLALIYSLLMFVGAGLEATLWGLGLAAAGLPIRWLSRRFATIPAAETVPTAPRE
ncbi:amino acid permease [Sphingomonas sp. LY29]|uniref:APC family permease n=1 Tax=unclassified Sphingomonas TaxID=196159 RepID=UPI002ADEBD33|nr:MULTISPECIES: amino acid permease [unclassified Sphingomonas]MEA1071620.1 amino acid permease [Sphingomonas sp. LY160]WRP25704.1 amino acid permease [Sphingomonas sp. LY29]